MQNGTVNILGTEYRITYKPDAEVCAAMGVPVGECGGYCNHYAKEIVIAALGQCNGSEDENEALRRENMRHELIHAFLNESGLGYNAAGTDCWPKNEEMVDWFAIQSPKIFKVFSSLGLL